MKANLQKLDLNILKCLQKNSKITNQDLADTIGLSPSSCLHHVRNLEKSGHIAKYRALVDLSKLCNSITLIVAVSMKQHSHQDFVKFEKFIQTIPEIVECHTVSGNYDFFMKIVCSDMDHYLALNNKLLESGVVIDSINTHVVMNENKPHTGFPLDILIDNNEVA